MMNVPFGRDFNTPDLGYWYPTERRDGTGTRPFGLMGRGMAPDANLAAPLYQGAVPGTADRNEYMPAGPDPLRGLNGLNASYTPGAGGYLDNLMTLRMLQQYGLLGGGGGLLGGGQQ